MIRLIVKRTMHANMGPEHRGDVPTDYLTFDIEHDALEKLLREHEPVSNQYINAVVVGAEVKP